jgi:small subunit ribosomal protein S6
MVAVDDVRAMERMQVSFALRNPPRSALLRAPCRGAAFPRLCLAASGCPARGCQADTSGGKSMPLYECVVIGRSEITQQQVDTIGDAVVAQVEADGATVRKREYWGLRSLAYRIKKNRKGHYLLLGLDIEPKALTEMERQLRLNEDVLRFLTIRVDEIDEVPSAVLARKSDDRGFRGPKPAGRFDSGRRRYDDREEFRAREEFRGGRDDDDDRMRGLQEEM